MTSPRRLAHVLLAGLLLAFSVSWVDHALWKGLGHGKPALRVFFPDQQYYLLRVHRVLLEGSPIASPYFHEHVHGETRFALAETIFLLLSKPLVPFIGTSLNAWAVVLRFLSAFGSCIALGIVFRRWARLTRTASAALAALVILWLHGTQFYTGYALTSWLLPFPLFGVVLIREALEAGAGWKRFALLAAATGLSLVHPVAFILNGLVAGLSLVFSLRDDRSAPAWRAAAAWAAVAAAAGFFFYGRFADGASLEIGETLARNLLVFTRGPTLPVTSARTVAILVLLVLVARRSAPADRRSWIVLLSVYAGSLIGLNANVVTGTYFLNDHYQIFLAPFLPIAAAMAFRSETRPTGRLALAAASLATAVLAEWCLHLLTDLRAWGSAELFRNYGLSLSLFTLAWVAFGGRVDAPRRIPRVLIVAGLALAWGLPILSMMAWLDSRTQLQKTVQAERAVIEALDGLPAGTVLSDAEHAATVAAYTPHFPYWSIQAFGDDLSGRELRARWKDAMRFFGTDRSYNEHMGIRGLYGHSGLTCLENGLLIREEPEAFSFFERHGLAIRKCHEPIDDAAWKALLLDAVADPAVAWRPSYRLDYLLIDAAAGETLPENLAHDFELVRRAPMRVYRYRGAE